MNKNVDYLKDILQQTMNLNRLRWAYEELLINENYYKHMYNDYKKRIDKAIESLEIERKSQELFYNGFCACSIRHALDVLKGVDSNE